MKLDDNNDVSATRSTAPSVADSGPTGEPLATTKPDAAGAAAPPPIASTRIRDPKRYQIIGEHGRGGLGRVSRAHDHDLGRDIAIKELISRGHVSEVRFLREALITARLEHPSIVPVYEAGRWPDGNPFYAMKLVSGRSLRELIAERTTVEQRIDLLHHVIAVADAIAYAHGRNIIHRDLKPANVIVGEFGETIVIDWGLAKDLTTAEPFTIGGGPFRTTHDDELTAAGSILGTPAYMAPEQERGEHVDQRADVFAIGAMLWELCALQKIPPTEPHLRRRTLRRAGIDKDLVTIIDKAIDPDPARRYVDAGALAADLKAFKSGVRIAARSYSMLAMLGHWMRRHRALAASVIAAIVLTFSGTVFYVRNIEAERDRAEASSNRLTLAHAELLLRSDPTAAFDLLQAYKGADPHRLAMLRAQAQGLGLSHLRARPHTLAILFARALPDGTLVTVGGDGTIAKTSPGGQSRIISRGVTPQPTLDYSDPHHLLAYACDATAICLFDVQAEASRPPPSDVSSFAPVALAFSPSGDLLAAISAHGETSVWRLSNNGSPNIRYQTTFKNGESIGFVDEHTIAARTSGRVHIIHLDMTDQSPAVLGELPVPGASDMNFSSELHLVTVGTATGALAIIDSQLNQLVRRETVCKGYVNMTVILPSRPAVAYACQDGDVGIWDLNQNKLSVLAYIEGGVATIGRSADGRYLLAGGNNGRLLVHDFTTDMLRSYLGHATRLTALLPPSQAFPYIVSGDTSGTVRSWPPPDASARVVIKTAASMYKAILLPDKGPLIAIGGGPTIPWYTRNGVSGELQGHNPSHAKIALATTQPSFAMYDLDDEVELWSFGPRSSSRTLKTTHGAVTGVVFASSDTRLVIGSRDGTVTEWSDSNDTYHDLGTIPEPVGFMREVPNTDMIVIVGASGTLWLADKMSISYLGKEIESITSVICSRDSRWLAIGTSQGAVRLYDILTRKASTIFATQSWIDSLAFSPDSAELAIATQSKVVLISIAGPGIHAARRASQNDVARWHEVELSGRSVAFSPDNKWLAVTCDHGDIWFYKREDNRWIHLSIGAAKVSLGKFSDDSAYFAASDWSGRAVLMDMSASIFN